MKTKYKELTDIEIEIIKQFEKINCFFSRGKMDYSKKYLKGEIGMIFGKRIIVK